MAEKKLYWMKGKEKKDGRRGETKVSDKDLIDYDEKFKQDYWFPPWGKYLAWFLSVAVIIVCSIVLTLYGATFGIVKSKIWLITVLLSLMISTFLVQPVKAVAMAVLLSYFFKTERDGFHKRLTVGMLRNPYDATKAKEVEKLRMKMSDCYKPPDPRQMKMRKAEIYYSTQIKNLIVDVVSYLIFLTVIILLAVSHKSGTTFFSTETAKRLVVTANYSDTIPYMRIKTLEQFYEYLNETLIPALMKNESLGYKPNQMINTKRTVRNETAIQDRGYTMEPNVKLLGQPLLRQLRVQKQSCSVYSENVPRRQLDCWAELTRWNMDTASYSQGWLKLKKDDPQPTGLEWEPWQYHESLIVRGGRMGIFFGGGYEMKLGKTIPNCRQMLRYIQHFYWIDGQTRVIYVDFLLYSAGANLFNAVTLIVYVSAGGIVIPSYSISTLEMSNPYWSQFIIIPILITLLFIYLLAFVMFETLKTKRISVWVYLKSRWSICTIVVITLGFLKVICEILKIAYSYYLMKDLEDAAGKDLIDFQPITLLEYLSDCLGCLLMLGAAAFIFQIATFSEVFYYWKSFWSKAGKIVMVHYLCFFLFLMNLAIFFWKYLGGFWEEFTFLWGSATYLLYLGMRKHDGPDPDYLNGDLSTSFIYAGFILVTLFSSWILLAIFVFFGEIISNKRVRNINSIKKHLTSEAVPIRYGSTIDEKLIKTSRNLNPSHVDAIRFQAIKRKALETISEEDYSEKFALKIAVMVVAGKADGYGTPPIHRAVIGDKTIMLSDRKLQHMKKIAEEVLGD